MMAGSRWKVYVILCLAVGLSRGQYNNPGGYGSSQYGQQGQYGQGQGQYGQTDRYNTDRYNNRNAAGAMGGGNSLEPFQSVYEWSRLDYNWIDEVTKQQAMSNRRFIPENNALAGIKVWRDRIFVTIPRWKDGVPVTIASVPKQPNQPTPRLDPFPNWQMQEIGNCSAFQFVQSMEIDNEGRMWIIDAGRINIMDGSSAQSRCPPKLVIIDLNSVQFNGNQFGSNQFGQPGFQGTNQYPNNQFPGQNPNQPYNQGQYPNQQNFNNPSQQYPNQQFGNNQYPNNQFSNNPNQQYPNSNQYNSNNPNQFQNNQYNNPNNPNNQYNRNQFGSNQYGNQNQQYGNQFNNTPRYDQFGNPIPGYQGNNPSGYNQGGYNQQGGFNQGGFNQGGFNQGFNTFGNNFRIVKSYNFPSNVASQYGNYLNDIVLDNTYGWTAYITDQGDDPGIIVYDFTQDRSWKVKDARSMRADPDVGFVNMNNIDVELRGKNIDGIALSPAAGNERTLYFSSLGSYNLYSLPTRVLKSGDANSDVSREVTDHGRKQSVTDGMIMDNRGNLYFGLLGYNAIGVWNTNRGRFTDSQRIMSRDNRALQWADTFAIDDTGNLYVVTNRLQNYITGRVSLDEPNYRILRAPIGAQSYLSPAQAGGADGQYGSSYGSNSYDSRYGYSNWYYGGASSAQVATGLVIFASILSFLFTR